MDEALKVLETHLIALGGLGHPGGILLQVNLLLTFIWRVLSEGNTWNGGGAPGSIEAAYLMQVIVGLGRHSVGGVARILPAVVRYLTDAGYNFREEPNNAGGTRC